MNARAKLIHSSLGLMLASLFSLLLVTPTSALPRDYSYRSAKLTTVLVNIGLSGGFSVIVDPEVGGRRINVSLSQTEPIDAFKWVVARYGLMMKKVKWEEGSKTNTYAVCSPGKMMKTACGYAARTFQIRHARLEELCRRLAKSLPHDIVFELVRDEQAKRLTLKTGYPADLETASKIIAELDK